MRLVQTTWSAVPHGGLVVDPAGRVWAVAGSFPTVGGALTVHLVDPEDGTRVTTTPHPSATVTTILAADPQLLALNVLRRTFPLLEVIG